MAFTDFPSTSLSPAGTFSRLETLFCLVFIALLPFRLWKLAYSERKLLPSWDAPTKALLALASCGVSAALLALTCRRADLANDIWALAAPAAACVAGLALCSLLLIEHRRSIRPSAVALSFLLACTFCELAWLAAPGKPADGNPGLAGLAIARVILQVLLIVLEAQGKERYLYPQYFQSAPEDTAGIVRGATFWWINPLLARGVKTILAEDDLPQLTGKLDSATLWEAMSCAWHQKDVRPESGLALPKVLLGCLASEALIAVPLRLLLIILEYAQPLLIRQTIQYVNRRVVAGNDQVQGYWIMLSAGVIYVGLAFVTAAYQNRIDRLTAMSRGSLIGLVFNRVFDVNTDGPDKGAAVTLMSNDISSLSVVSGMVLALGGYIIGVIVGLLMLYREVGWLCFLPILMIVFGSRVSQYVAKNLRSRQKSWSDKTQERISAVSSMLSSMRAIKAMGLSSVVAKYIATLRTTEIDNANKIRWMMIIYNASANFLGILTPILTVILYAITGNKSLDAETAFTTVAVLTMVIHPANMVLTIVPRLVASSANFDRVQEYLTQSSRCDQRIITPDNNDIVLTNATTKQIAGSQPVLEDVNLRIPWRSVAAVSGAVGSGKSTLARVILGETSLAQGLVKVPTNQIGLCTQSAWLPDGTIRDFICSFVQEVDEQWYKEVIQACCLDYDLGMLRDGDETTVGTQGANISGGQRQRIALARLLYARCRVVVLDDSFSALDRSTGDQVVKSILGPDGILRKTGTTVVWITNNVSHYPFADQALLLKDGQLQDVKFDKSAGPEAVKLPVEETSDQDSTAASAPIKDQPKTRARKDAAADLSRKTGDFTLYALYFRHAGLINSLLMLLCTGLYSFCVTFPQYWLRWWTEADGQATIFYSVGYLILGLLAWFFTSYGLWVSYLLMAATSGARLHQMLLDIVVGAPLAYFAQDDIGMTLNRFSQDIGLIDNQLPSASSALAVQITKLIAQVVLLVIVQKLLLLTLPVCFVVVYVIQKIYLQTSRQLRYLDLESQSQVLTSFLETVDGVVTIRAFNWERKSQSSCQHALNASQRASYTLLCLQRWLNLVLDLIVAAIATGLIVLAVKFRGTTSGAAIGVALNIVLVANSTLLKLVESWTSLEISLSAVARLRGMMRDVPAEDQPGENGETSGYWPSDGAIEIRGVDAYYSSENHALRDLSLSIKPGQKVLLCGRTGSGKSTTMLVLLRLIHSTGLVKVDGIDLSGVPRSVVRQRCFITIPQETYFNTDVSLRENMDPTGTSTDDIIIEALRKVHLWEAISATNQTTSPLPEALCSLPTLSTGHRQLLALARALVRRHAVQAESSAKPVLLLDEATSALDPRTEALIHDVIDDEFTARGHTVVMITHRPGMAARRMRGGRDVVVRMGDGSVEGVVAVDEWLETDGEMEGDGE